MMGDDATNLTGPERDDGYTEYGVRSSERERKGLKFGRNLSKERMLKVRE